MITLKFDECEGRRSPSKSGRYRGQHAGTEEDSSFCALEMSLQAVRQAKAVLDLMVSVSADNGTWLGHDCPRRTFRVHTYHSRLP